MISLLAAAALALTPVQMEAAPVVLVCTGSEIVTSSEMNPDLTWKNDRTATNFSHQLLIDFAARTVKLNGREMVVRRMDDDAVVFSTMKAGLLAMAWEPPVFTIDRRTGVYQFGAGSGTCTRRAPTERMF